MLVYDTDKSYDDLCELMYSENGTGIEIDEKLQERKQIEDREKHFLNIVALIKNLDVTVGNLKEAINEITEKKKRLETRKEWLRTYLISELRQSNHKKIKNYLHSATLSRGGKQVGILDENKIPPEFKKIKTIESIDKKKILETYKENGELVPGAIIEDIERLIIK